MLRKRPVCPRPLKVREFAMCGPPAAYRGTAACVSRSVTSGSILPRCRCCLLAMGQCEPKWRCLPHNQLQGSPGWLFLRSNSVQCHWFGNIGGEQQAFCRASVTPDCSCAHSRGKYSAQQGYPHPSIPWMLFPASKLASCMGLV